MWLVSTLRFQFSDKALESETAQAERKFSAIHLREETCPAIDAVFTYIDMLFNGINWPSLTESYRIEYPTATKDGPQRNRFIDGRDENFVYVELARRLVEGFVWSEKVVSPDEALSRLVDPYSFNLENIQFGQLEVRWKVMRRTRSG